MSAQNPLRNPEHIKALACKIAKVSENLDDINLMEVCGTHTQSIARFGIRELLPKNVDLVSGPGCPVCVTPNELIDKMIAVAQRDDVIVTTFGDMVRVPGSESSLQQEQAAGADIRVVYSPLESLKIAKDNVDKKIVFLGVGFETTTPLSAAVIKHAQAQNIINFYLLCAHKTMPDAIQAIINDKQTNIDAIILPGHVSTIIGLKPYEFIAKDYDIPGCIAGFEPVEILSAILELLQNLNDMNIGKEAKISNAYKAGCKDKGNATARKMIEEVFEEADSQWRGIGPIPNSGLRIREQFQSFDALKNLEIVPCKTHTNAGCRCGDVLRGIIRPKDCPLFAKACNPQKPIGPCMVSTEGSCSAEYKYRR